MDMKIGLRNSTPDEDKTCLLTKLPSENLNAILY